MDYIQIPSDEVIIKTQKALEERGMKVSLVAEKGAALELIKKMIPQGSKVMNGSSTTLAEIGLVEYLKTASTGWNNLHEEILKETDWPKQADLRRRALVDADVFLASANAITESGEVVAVDNTGSRVGAFPFAAKKLLLVVGAQKIVPSLDVAFKRIREYVKPLEDVRMQQVYHMNSGFGKWVIIEHERVPNRIEIILVKEKLGF